MNEKRTDMNEKRKVIYIVAFIAISLFFLGAPVINKSISAFKVTKAKSAAQALQPVANANGLVTVNLKGLKNKDIPAINIHTTTDLYFYNQEFGASVDFGSLEALGANAVYRGQQQRLSYLGKGEFKVLTDKSNKNIVTGLINHRSIFVPLKKVQVKALSKQKASDFSAVISDFLIFMKGSNCFEQLAAGDNLKSKCPEFIYEPPYKLDYLPETQTLTFQPTGNKFWDKVRVYKTPLNISYGKVKGASYNSKQQISAKQKIGLANAKVTAIGAFELNYSSFASATKKRSSSGNYQANGCGIEGSSSFPVDIGHPGQTTLIDTIENAPQGMETLSTPYDSECSTWAAGDIVDQNSDKAFDPEKACPSVQKACLPGSTGGCELVPGLSGINAKASIVERQNSDGTSNYYVYCSTPPESGSHLTIICSPCERQSSSSSISSSSNSSTSSDSSQSSDSSSSSSSQKWHKDCHWLSGLCVPVIGEGEDRCSDVSGCQKTCMDGVCAISPGTGGIQCSDNTDCGHRECSNDGYCTQVSGKGEDQCQKDTDCGAKVCNYNHICEYRRVYEGEEVTKCSENQDCGHRECRQGVCTQVEGKGSNQCENSRDCASSSSSISSSSSSSSSHSEVSTTSSNSSFSSGDSQSSNSSDSSTTSNSMGYRAMLSGIDARAELDIKKLEFKHVGNVYGSSSAPLKIEVYHDLKCGMCRKWFEETAPEIIKSYVNEGLVQFKFVDFPIIMRDMEMTLASASICAGDQGKYLEYVNVLYREIKQSDQNKISDYAKEAGLNLEKFNSCVNSKSKLSEIKANVEKGKAAGIYGTPMFLINGELVKGAKSAREFSEILNAKLVN